MFQTYKPNHLFETTESLGEKLRYEEESACDPGRGQFDRARNRSSDRIRLGDIAQSALAAGGPPSAKVGA
jgi:hypothetical protein